MHLPLLSTSSALPIDDQVQVPVLRLGATFRGTATTDSFDDIFDADGVLAQHGLDAAQADDQPLSSDTEQQQSSSETLPETGTTPKDLRAETLAHDVSVAASAATEADPPKGQLAERTPIPDQILKQHAVASEPVAAQTAQTSSPHPVDIGVAAPMDRAAVMQPAETTQPAQKIDPWQIAVLPKADTTPTSTEVFQPRIDGVRSSPDKAESETAAHEQRVVPDPSSQPFTVVKSPEPNQTNVAFTPTITLKNSTAAALGQVTIAARPAATRAISAADQPVVLQPLHAEIDSTQLNTTVAPQKPDAQPSKTDLTTAFTKTTPLNNPIAPASGQSTLLAGPMMNNVLLGAGFPAMPEKIDLPKPTQDVGLQPVSPNSDALEKPRSADAPLLTPSKVPPFPPHSNQDADFHQNPRPATVPLAEFKTVALAPTVLKTQAIKEDRVSSSVAFQPAKADGPAPTPSTPPAPAIRWGIPVQHLVDPAAAKEVFPIEPLLGEPRTTSVSANVLATQTPRPELPPHIARQIAEIIQQAPNRPVEITLRPQELGSVRLTLQNMEAGIVVHLTAERPETLDMMRRNIDQLGQDFHALGYSNIAFSFSSGNPDTDAQSDGDKPAFVSSSMADTTAASDQASKIHLTSGTANGVDMRI